MWKEKKAGDPVRPWDLLNPNIKQVDEDTYNYRYNICLSCPSLIQATKTCKECGCFMAKKCKLPHAFCPIGKWGPYIKATDVV